MTLPCIDIRWHDVGLYGWAIMYGSETVDGDDGDSSITECLQGAARSLADGERLAEVRYRGIHMGTFQKVELAEYSGGVADRISESYGTLVHNL